MSVPRVATEGQSQQPPYPEFPSYHDSCFCVLLEVWAHGWTGYLRPSELMMLMILCKINGNREAKPIEVPARRRKERFGLSGAMWSQGTRGVERRGILQSFDPSEHDIDPITFAPRSYRMVFRLNGDTIEDALTRSIDHEMQMKIMSQID